MIVQEKNFFWGIFKQKSPPAIEIFFLPGLTSPKTKKNHERSHRLKQ